MLGTIQQSLRPSIQVAERVADVKEVTATELSPLYETIDTDALDTLFQSETDAGEKTGHVQFQYEGYTIVVSSDGRVELADHDV